MQLEKTSILRLTREVFRIYELALMDCSEVGQTTEMARLIHALNDLPFPSSEEASVLTQIDPEDLILGDEIEIPDEHDIELEFNSPHYFALNSEMIRLASNALRNAWKKHSRNHLPSEVWDSIPALLHDFGRPRSHNEIDSATTTLRNMRDKWISKIVPNTKPDEPKPEKLPPTYMLRETEDPNVFRAVWSNKHRRSKAIDFTRRGQFLTLIGLIRDRFGDSVSVQTVDESGHTRSSRQVDREVKISDLEDLLGAKGSTVRVALSRFHGFMRTQTDENAAIFADQEQEPGVYRIDLPVYLERHDAEEFEQQRRHRSAAASRRSS